MKFTCEKSTLSEIISNVSLAVASKSSVPTSEGILIECNTNSVSFTGYNLELGIKKLIVANVEREGSIVLDASILSNIVAKMPNSEITLDCDDRYLVTISCSSAEFVILGLDAVDFPQIPTVTSEKSFTINPLDLANMIQHTLFAVAKDDKNPVLMGTQFNIKDKELKLISIDGVRLALKRKAIEIDFDTEFVVPHKTLSELQKILQKLESLEVDEDVKVNISAKHVIFDFYGYKIFSRLLEGKFMDYNNAVPNDFKTQVTADTKKFTERLNRASIIISDKAKSPVKCEFSDKSVKLFCETALGKINDSFDVVVEGEPLRIGFNNTFMLDALKACESDEILIKLNGPLSPIVILPPEGDDYLYLVLPVRLSDEKK